MLKTVKLDRRRTIQLPAGLFHADDRVAVLTEGGTVIVKKLASVRLSEIASLAPGRAPSLKTIAREIRRYRHEKHK